MEQPSLASTPVGRVAARVQSILSVVQENGSHQLLLYDTEPPYSGNFEITTVESQQRDQVLFVRVGFAFTAQTTEDVPRDFYKIAASFLVTYGLIDQGAIPEIDLEQFAKVNGMLNTNPYWREYVHSCMARANMPPVQVPVYNPVPRSKFSDRQPEQTANDSGDK